MPVGVSDSGPLRYLIELNETFWLPRMFQTLLVPAAVRAELDHHETPAVVRTWMASPPAWLVPRRIENTVPVAMMIASGLDAGEAEAIALAAAERADLLLMDDRIGVRRARAEGFAVTGTLGLLDRAARLGLLDLADAFTRLRQTNFRCAPAVMDAVLAKHRADR